MDSDGVCETVCEGLTDCDVEDDTVPERVPERVCVRVLVDVCDAVGVSDRLWLSVCDFVRDCVSDGVPVWVGVLVSLVLWDTLGVPDTLDVPDALDVKVRVGLCDSEAVLLGVIVELGVLEPD